MSTSPIIIISGPTSSGKTNFLHQIFSEDDVIINGDSRQMYKEYSIGVAKPNPETIKKYQYRCIDFLSLENNSQKNNSQINFSSAEFLKKVKSIVGNELSRKKIIIGGSHFYLDVLKSGLPNHSENISPETKKKVNSLYQEKGLDGILEELKEKDRQYFEIVDQKNPRRIIRALEYIEQYKSDFSSYREQRTSPNFKILNLVIIPSRKEMISKIEADIEYRLKNGWIEEVKSLMKKNISLDHAIGYFQIGEYLQKKISLAEATEKIKIKTLRFAKQQINWFKKESFNGIFLYHNEVNFTEDVRDQWLQKIPEIDLNDIDEWLLNNKEIHEKKVRIKYNEIQAKKLINCFCEQ